MSTARAISVSTANREYAIGLARAFGGALLFSLPILMTMETWELGFYMDRLRLALLLCLSFPLLVALAYYLGFEACTSWQDAVLDAFAAIAVAVILALVILFALGVLGTQTTFSQAMGQIALQSVTGSFGALLAQSQFGHTPDEEVKRRESGAMGEYLFMAAGALFLGANITPTEEVSLIAYTMTSWHGVGLVALSLAFMHAFVYAVGFRGQHDRAAEKAWHEFLRFTVIGYFIALTISGYMLWSFGRLENVAIAEAVRVVVVLGFPASIGAAAARLVL